MRDLKLDHSFKIVQVQVRVVDEERAKGATANQDTINRALETIAITATNARDMIKSSGGSDEPWPAPSSTRVDRVSTALKKDFLRIASVNVNGLRAAYKNGMAEWLEPREVDILCLQEVRAPPDDIVRKLIGEGWHILHTELRPRVAPVWPLHPARSPPPLALALATTTSISPGAG